jgi:transposase InsO family protein
MEIIRLVEESTLPARRTLRELGVARSTFYIWYRNHVEQGYAGLSNRKPGPRRFWNRIPEREKQWVRKVALEKPELSPRELAWHITDRRGYYISESSVYRILKSFDLITSPAYIVMSAADEFRYKPRRVHELWQSDFTYLKVTGWGWYYLLSVLDDYSRYIIAWRLFTTMSARDVTELLDEAIARTGVANVSVRHRPRLLSDNGSCFIAKDLKAYLTEKGMRHTRGKPHHPQTQGKIERYHRSLKNVVTLQNYYVPWELEQELGRFVNYYNQERVHESLQNLTPADVYTGRARTVLTRRERIKRQTLRLRRQQNLERKEVSFVPISI